MIRDNADLECVISRRLRHSALGSATTKVSSGDVWQLSLTGLDPVVIDFVPRHPLSCVAACSVAGVSDNPLEIILFVAHYSQMVRSTSLRNSVVSARFSPWWATHEPGVAVRLGYRLQVLEATMQSLVKLHCSARRARNKLVVKPCG